ncbi:hypothetical protein [Shewanella sp.]|uniref:hypothetical protein n=1 Tax=Shewanella sp. TaxID=50422 RepID=UPI003F3A7DF4
MTPNQYGLNSSQQAKELAVRVCNVLGHGENGTAVAMLLETAAAETQLGQAIDPSPSNGFGLCQLDHISIKDIRKRARTRDVDAVWFAFQVDMRGIKPEQIAKDPLASLIFCRLHYKLITERIPQDLEARAGYWKRHYNTAAGKGTVEHYITSAQQHLYPHRSTT